MFFGGHEVKNVRVKQLSCYQKEILRMKLLKQNKKSCKVEMESIKKYFLPYHDVHPGKKEYQKRKKYIGCILSIVCWLDGRSEFKLAVGCKEGEDYWRYSA